jgi:hypothetical protein
MEGASMGVDGDRQGSGRLAAPSTGSGEIDGSSSDADGGRGGESRGGRRSPSGVVGWLAAVLAVTALMAIEHAPAEAYQFVLTVVAVVASSIDGDRGRGER